MNVNPMWFFIGLEAADRVMSAHGPSIRRGLKKIVREAWWAVEEQIEGQRLVTAHHRFLHELPTTDERR